ncbi:ATP-binding protein [Agrobacterium salinitolerans]|nr:ATP-binding protein [Agrobacterium salinitolerans]
MNANVNQRLNARDRDSIIQALMAGVVPRVGLAHVQVGRNTEVTALVRDIERVGEGGSGVRFVIGEYGAGKTFFLNLVRLVALEKKCVTIHADLAPERRLHASNGHARALYTEAVRNMATRTKPEGGALQSVIEKFIGECMREAEQQGASPEAVIQRRLISLEDHVGGFDFVSVLRAYWRGSETGNDDLKSAALRWLRGEYSTKTEARASLGVRNIIEDDKVYDSIKLLSAFVRLAGYSGLVVVFDEMVNIYKLQHALSREKNHEQILRIVNDVLQGSAQHIGFVFGGTPEFLTDSRRGLYSYEALHSRLSENSFARDGIIDVNGPVIRLQSLSQEELLLLLRKVRAVYDAGKDVSVISDEGIMAFMTHCFRKVGEAYFRTPRNTIKAFAQLLSVLEQNPSVDWRVLLESVDVAKDNGRLADTTVEQGDDVDGDLTTIRL